MNEHPMPASSGRRFCVSARLPLVVSLLLVTCVSPLCGEVGDPQICTDHPWYPGELAISDFDRLFATQADVYERVTGHWNGTDQEKALASWLWRNTHFWHGEAGGRDLWGDGLGGGRDTRQREYWTGLFALATTVARRISVPKRIWFTKRASVTR